MMSMKSRSSTVDVKDECMLLYQPAIVSLIVQSVARMNHLVAEHTLVTLQSGHEKVISADYSAMEYIIYDFNNTDNLFLRIYAT